MRKERKKEKRRDGRIQSRRRRTRRGSIVSRSKAGTGIRKPANLERKRRANDRKRETKLRLHGKPASPALDPAPSDSLSTAGSSTDTHDSRLECRQRVAQEKERIHRKCTKLLQTPPPLLSVSVCLMIGINRLMSKIRGQQSRSERGKPVRILSPRDPRTHRRRLFVCVCCRCILSNSLLDLHPLIHRRALPSLLISSLTHLVFIHHLAHFDPHSLPDDA